MIDTGIACEGIKTYPRWDRKIDVDIYGLDEKTLDVKKIVAALGGGVFLEVIGKEQAMKYFGLLVEQEEEPQY